MMQHIPKSAQTTTNWSGGTTTQLFIYPPEANYIGRNFLFRISTATVETETSTFTDLTGFNRILMLLNGRLAITHNNHQTHDLTPYHPHYFDGGWQTTAVGKVTDFNVISKPSVKADVMVVELEANQSTQLNTAANWVCLYISQGSLMVISATTKLQAVAGDFIVINDEKSIELNALTESNVVASFIHLH